MEPAGVVARGRQARARLRGDEGVALRRWIRTWNAMARWTRYEVHGLEHLLVDHPVLVVGYHGRPIAHDLCMLQNVLYARLGYLPHPIFHAAFDKNPKTAAVLQELGFLLGDDQRLADAVARREHIFVTPGGTAEGCRSFRHRYQPRWGRRTGYLRLALKYGLPIVPVAAAGTDDTFLGFNDGHAWGKKLGVPHDMPAWLGVGLVGVWPLAVPFPVKIRQVVGPAIDLQAQGPVDPADREALQALHRRVVGAVEGLLARARGGAGAEPGGEVRR
ncbi:acyltransferase [Myxococcota bacterium]|nr:acyltransferase [Myxococcota bacterium]